MIVKKFTAPTTRDALRLVRDALGPDALILSSRVQDGQVEIMAVAEADMAALTGEVVAAAPPPATRIRHDIPGLRPRGAPTRTPPVTPGAATPVPPATPAPDRRVEELASEIKEIRSLIERQLVRLAWRDLQAGDPLRFDVLRRLLDLGFSPRLARQLSRALPGGLDAERALRWVRAALARNLHCAAADADLIERGGIYALVGPTGVGKTTTVAKLAARCVLKMGAAKLALITTDTYRIGAYEQLKIYGQILDVPVYAVKDASDLTRNLNDLRDRHLILIDTVGMSQRDRRIAEQIALLSGRHGTVRRLLLLAAPADARTLDDVVRAYRGDELAGVILTKMDEALNLAPALDVVVRERLRLYYVTNGQRVPEDLHLANPLYLVDRAFRAEPSPTHTPQADEYPLVIGTREEDAHAFVAELQGAS